MNYYLYSIDTLLYLLYIYNLYIECIYIVSAFLLPRPKMETSICNTYFMSGKIKELKKKVYVTLSKVYVILSNF